MRVLFVIFFTLFIQNAIALQNIVISDNDKLIFYDMERNIQKEINSINNLELWEFGCCYHHDNKYIVTLYKKNDYYFFYQNKFLSEIIVEFDENDVILKNDTIIENKYFYRVSNSELEHLSITNIEDLYCNKIQILNNMGFVETKDSNGNIFSILEPKQIDKGYKIGYFNPSFSSDREKIICERIVGKYDWRKIKELPTIVEYNIHKNEFKDFYIEGCCPLYSNDDKYILYKKGNQCFVYDTNSNENIFSCNATQAIWVE